MAPAGKTKRFEAEQLSIACSGAPAYRMHTLLPDQQNSNSQQHPRCRLWNNSRNSKPLPAARDTGVRDCRRAFFQSTAGHVVRSASNDLKYHLIGRFRPFPNVAALIECAVRTESIWVRTHDSWDDLGIVVVGGVGDRSRWRGERRGIAASRISKVCASDGIIERRLVPFVLSRQHPRCDAESLRWLELPCHLR